MSLEPISGLTSPTSGQKKDINGRTTDKSGNTLLDLFMKKLSKDGTGSTCSIGDQEPTRTYAAVGDYRIDLQKYNNDGSANFAIQTDGVTLAVLFMEPNTEFTQVQVKDGFNSSLNSNGTNAYRLP
jgi:hypothetical protein